MAKLLPINNFSGAGSGGPLLRPHERDVLDEMGELAARFAVLEEPVKRLLARARAQPGVDIIEEIDIFAIVSDGDESSDGRWRYTCEFAEFDDDSDTIEEVVGTRARTFTQCFNLREQVPESDYENLDCSTATPPEGYTTAAGLITRQRIQDGTPVRLRKLTSGDASADPPEEPKFAMLPLGVENPACGWCPEEDDPE
jgi:hypothetical protein